MNEALSKGYDDLLWLFNGKWITEASTRNVFFVFNRDGMKELVTPPENGIIYAGITRDTVLKIADTWVSQLHVYH